MTIPATMSIPEPEAKAAVKRPNAAVPPTRLWATPYVPLPALPAGQEPL